MTQTEFLPAKGIAALAARYRLSQTARRQLEELLRILSEDPLAPTSVTEPARVLDEHLADSLVALEVDPVRGADRLVDLGAGAGIPGLPMAIALPGASFALVESTSRKCAFIDRTAAACGLDNVEVVCSRAEAWLEGKGTFDVALARALAPLDVVLEYAAPLLRVGGCVVAWRGQRDPLAEAEGRKAADLLGLREEEIRPVKPFAAVRNRHLYLFSKVMETPDRFPRRPGVAVKRPLGSS